MRAGYCGKRSSGKAFHGMLLGPASQGVEFVAEEDAAAIARVAAHRNHGGRNQIRTLRVEGAHVLEEPAAVAFVGGHGVVGAVGEPLADPQSYKTRVYEVLGVGEEVGHER